MASIKKNLGYQLFYQVLVTCMPLITAPYLARVLGSEQLGVFSFTNSIVSYFTLFAMLGVTSYGTRSIATCKDDKDVRSITFWEIFVFQIITSLFCIVLFLLYFIFFCRDNRLVLLLQGINLLSVLFDINWLFFGVEDFKITVTRNAVIKVFSVLLILLTVKSSSDLWIYTFIMTFSTLASNFVLWKFVGKYISFRSIKTVNKSGIVKHIKSNLMLFIPLAAMHIYHAMDKTMLGALATYDESGFYYNADKVVGIPVGIITGFGTAMLPRVSALVGEGEKKKSDEYFNLFIRLIALVTYALAFGIASVSKEFVPIFFGDGYDSCILLIICLSPVLVIKGYCYVSRTLYLIPNHLEKVYTGSVIFGAIVNLIANIIFIPRFGALGAVFGTVLAEFSSCAWQFVLMRKYIHYGKSLIKSFVYFVFGLIMFIIVRLSSYVIQNNVFSLIFEIFCGAICFLLFCWIYLSLTKNSIFVSLKNSFCSSVNNHFVHSKHK